LSPVVHIEILPFYLSWLNRICDLHIYLTVVYHLKIGVRIWLIMDISFVSDGWSYSWNPGRFSSRPSYKFPTTATSPAKSSRSHGPTDGTSEPASRLRWANFITSLEVVMNPHRLVTKTFSVLSPHCSIKQTSPLMLMLGSAL
jgi:hypothetical protein